MGGVIDWVDENFENIDWSPTELSSILWSLFVKNVGAQNEGLVRKVRANETVTLTTFNNHDIIPNQTTTHSQAWGTVALGIGRARDPSSSRCRGPRGDSTAFRGKLGGEGRGGRREHFQVAEGRSREAQEQ